MAAAAGTQTQNSGATTTFQEVRLTLHRWDKVPKKKGFDNIHFSALSHSCTAAIYACMFLCLLPQGSKAVRERMLLDFVRQCSDMTGPQLEQQFCDCASLFLARVTSWMRITYVGNNLSCSCWLRRGLRACIHHSIVL